MRGGTVLLVRARLRAGDLTCRILFSVSAATFYESMFYQGVGSFLWLQTREIGLGYIALSFLFTFLLFPQDTYYLSAEECITAGNFQNQQPNICRLSPDGHFGSKFVTVVATGINWPRLAPALWVTRELSLVNRRRICSSARSHQMSWSPFVLFNKGFALLYQVNCFFILCAIFSTIIYPVPYRKLN